MTEKVCLVLAYSDVRFDPRILKQCEALSESGYKVKYYGVSFSKESFGSTKEFCFDINLLFKRGKGKISQLFEYFFLMFCFFFVQLRYLNKCKLVFIHNMPNFLVFSAIPLKLFGATVVLDLHDDTSLAVSKIVSHPIIRRLFTYVENNLALRLPSYLMTVNNELRRKLLQLTTKKIHVFHNCPNIINDRVDKKYKVNDIIKLVFIGHIGTHYGLDRLIEFMSKITLKFKVTLDIYGDGEELSRLEELAKELGVLKNVNFHGRYVVSNLPEILRGYDLGVALYPKNELTDILLPVKILEYTINKLPTLATRLRVTQEYFDDESLIWTDDYDEFESNISNLFSGRIKLKDHWSAADSKVSPLRWENEKIRFLKLVNTNDL